VVDNECRLRLIGPSMGEKVLRGPVQRSERCYKKTLEEWGRRKITNYFERAKEQGKMAKNTQDNLAVFRELVGVRGEGKERN